MYFRDLFHTTLRLLPLWGSVSLGGFLRSTSICLTNPLSTVAVVRHKPALDKGAISTPCASL
jgi:hypothetical protein